MIYLMILSMIFFNGEYGKFEFQTPSPENFSVNHIGKNQKIKEKRSKFRVNLELEKIFFSSSYDTTISPPKLPKYGFSKGIEIRYLLYKNFHISTEVTYARLPLLIYSPNPTDRLWFLRIISVKGGVSNGINHPLRLPVTLYLGLKIGFCKSAEIIDFLNGAYCLVPLSNTFGSDIFGGIDYNIGSYLTLEMNTGYRWHTVKDDEEEIYNLSGLYFQIKVGYRIRVRS